MSFNSLSNADNASPPPRVVGTDPDVAWQNAGGTAAAASVNLWTNYTGPDGVVGKAPAGKVWIELEAVAFDVYVRFSRTGTSGTTAQNGSIIKAGATAVKYLVEPNVKDVFIDYVSPGGASWIKWRVCSPVQERYRA